MKVGDIAEHGDKDVQAWKLTVGKTVGSMDATADRGKQDLPLYQMVGDNLGLQIQAKHTILSKRNRSIHWFNMVATNERVVDITMSDESLRLSILNIESRYFLSSTEDIKYIKTEFTVLTSHVLFQFM